MKKILLTMLPICAAALSGCMSTVIKTGSMPSAEVTVEITHKPVTADLIVSEQKVRGVAQGLADNAELLAKEAVAKALGQDPPNVEGADVLVGLEVFTEQTNMDMKVTVTGYPAWYTNFRTVAPGDSAYLVITDAPQGGGSGGSIAGVGGQGLFPGLPSFNLFGGGDTAKAGKIKKGRMNLDWYLTPRWNMLGAFAGYGWWSFDIEGGMIFRNGMFVGLDFGVGVAESEKGSEYKDHSTIGYTVNIGAEYDLGMHDLKIVYGVSVGYWNTESYRSNYYESKYMDRQGIFGPFVGVRWNNLELFYRGLMGGGHRSNISYDYYDYDERDIFGYTNQLMIGYNIKIAR